MSIAAFLEAIRATPDDDTPRLVFADWLDENGDDAERARAELIRVQCELARWVPDLTRRTELQERERTLIARHGETWLGALTSHGECRFERGLVHLHSTDDVQPNIHALQVAWVESLSGTALPRFTSLSALDIVSTLDLRGRALENDAFCDFCDRNRSTRLPRLNLANNELTDRSLSTLVVSPLFAGLTWLDLRNNRLTSQGAALLLEAAEGSRLRHLDLHGHSFNRSVSRRLALWRRRMRHSSDNTRVLNSLGMEFARIPAGTFLMGSPETEPRRADDEGPQHVVTISRPFYHGVYLVTQEQYEAVMGNNPAAHNSRRNGSLAHPVESVSWDEAVEFCRRLSELEEEREAGRRYRLPTEAEWEYACRAGTTSPFWFGHALSSTQANFDGAAPYGGVPSGPNVAGTTRVGSYPPNGFGLYDMHGNVWEWCQDWYRAGYYAESPTVDPPGPPSGDRRVLRGGSWYLDGQHLRSAYRNNNVSPETRGQYYGFRVALDVAV